MRKPNEETLQVLPELIERLKVSALSLDEIRLITGWGTYRCIMQHIDQIGDSYPIYSPAKNYYKILTESDFIAYENA